MLYICFFFSSRRRHTRYWRDWSSDVCSSDLSYSACGIPYWVGDVVEDRDELIARTPREFAARDIEVRTGTRAEELDLDAGTVRTGTGETLGFDQIGRASGRARV